MLWSAMCDTTVALSERRNTTTPIACGSILAARNLSRTVDGKAYYALACAAIALWAMNNEQTQHRKNRVSFFKNVIRQLARHCMWLQIDKSICKAPPKLIPIMSIPCYSRTSLQPYLHNPSTSFFCIFCVRKMSLVWTQGPVAEMPHLFVWRGL